MAGSAEGLYSRQLYVLGGGARRLAGARVLVSGLRGTGAQVAAALVAAGTGCVVLHDGGTARTADRGQQFLLGESDMGQNRAEASQRVLAELNPNTVVAAHTGELSEAFLASFQVVVLTESSLEEQLHIGDFCHDRGICFIVADAKGLAGQLFCDFGKHFIVEDPAEGDPVCAIVQDISQGNPGVVTYKGTEDSYGPLFSDGDLVRFSGVEGMTELNDQEPIRVRALGELPRVSQLPQPRVGELAGSLAMTVTSVPLSSPGAFKLEICDTSSFSLYRCGGLVSQVRLRQEHSYEPMSRSLVDPKIQVVNPKELPRSRSLHAAFQALHAFRKERGHLPRPRAWADAERVLELARSLGMEQGPLDEDVVRAFASVSAGDLCPMAAITGAMAAQEVLKAITGKFLPLDQWLYFDALECMALEGAERLTEEDCAPRGSRYDGQIAIFGDAFQERLGSQKYFVVGAGAIGCELLKNFAMMGLAAGPGGDITVTDMDSIAPSNLHRQLLYRTADISKPKSEVAAAAVRCMNPDIKVTPHQNQVGPATELLYGDDFFRSLDGVASALDTLEARAYLESRCLRYLTPLLDSGTEGPRGNVLPVVPSLTDLLRPGATPRDGTFPLCTLRYFPRTIQHTLQWARDEFEGLFQLPAEHIKRFMEDPGFPEQLPAGKALEVLEQVRWSLRERPGDWRDCLRWARRHWQSRYHDAIAQLLHNYPPEHETSPGVPFWSGDKNCPHPLTFDPDNNTHLDYILAAAHLFAQAHKVPPCNDRTAARDILRGMVLPPFVPQDGLQIPLTEEQEEGQVPADTRQLAELTQDLEQRRQELVGGEVAQVPLMDPIYFDKDDDIHVNFITAASNLRAENYGIPPADWMTSKRIAGRILPAIITTTAAVAGLACLEVYKLVWGCQDLSRYRNSHLRLSDCWLLRVQPLPPRTYQYGGREWSSWDRLEMRADRQEVTVQEVLDWLKKTHGWTVTKLLHGFTMLYDREEEEDRRTQQLAQRLLENSDDTGEPRRRVLELSYVCEGEDAEAEDDARPPLLCSLP
ncbi:PREDICTED: ubiquitin-like modifier-activating enzyme 7 isoform X3 [Calidris pugnax]|uniref:ubiquitin-like modifier-activating enzyme 7 isoform X3 n=1 Tax=Calidris pugnax TaxID=198806 RepID=UPI00071D7939|nr:PREDICTED: ubiquitin-like modifier-activating enzyme 7 isoform X3 [Calidris pugnax]